MWCKGQWLKISMSKKKHTNKQNKTKHTVGCIYNRKIHFGGQWSSAMDRKKQALQWYASNISQRCSDQCSRYLIWTEWMSLISRIFLNTWSWLVVEPTHLKNMLVKLDHETPNRDETKTSLKNHLGHGSWLSSTFFSFGSWGAIVGIDCQEKSLTTSSASWSRRERRNGTGSCVFGLAV